MKKIANNPATPPPNIVHPIILLPVNNTVTAQILVCYKKFVIYKLNVNKITYATKIYKKHSHVLKDFIRFG